MSREIDTKKAKELLNKEWSRIQNEDEAEYIDDDFVSETIPNVLEGSQLTYRYILITNVLAKAANGDIHYRSLQAKAELDGAYNARSLGHDVIVEFDKDNGERIGGSNEPFLNQPARNPEWEMSVPARSDAAKERLYVLLKKLEEKTENGELDPIDVLRQTLQEYSEMEAKTIDFDPPTDVSYNKLANVIATYLQESGGGERLAAVTAAALQAYYEHANPGVWEIDAEHANVPDEFSKSAGDVEIFKEDELQTAVEVKDKPTDLTAISHAISSAKEHKLAEYLFLVGSGFDFGEEDRCLQRVEESTINLKIMYPDELISLLKIVDDSERSLFLEAVADFLNSMRATDENKSAYKKIVAEIEES